MVVVVVSGVLTLTVMFVAVKLSGLQPSGNTVAPPVVKMGPNTGENIRDWNVLRICSTLGKVFYHGGQSVFSSRQRQTDCFSTDLF